VRGFVIMGAHNPSVPIAVKGRQGERAIGADNDFFFHDPARRGFDRLAPIASGNAAP
jgi:hypothetical protein